MSQPSLVQSKAPRPYQTNLLDKTVQPPTEADYAAHERCAISRLTLDAAGVHRLEHADAAFVVGRSVKGSAKYGGIIYPYYWPGDSEPRGRRLRRDYPETENGKPKDKYLSPPGARNMLYFPPCAEAAALTDVSVPLTIVEGEKKTLAVSEHHLERRENVLVIGIAGVWGWKGKTGQHRSDDGKEIVDEKGVIPDFDKITWKGRNVVIIFDADVAHNRKVAAARRALAAELKKRGAKVRIVNLPADGPKGVDDFLAARGSEALAELLAEAKPPVQGSGVDLITLVKDKAEIFHDAASETYAAVMIDGRRETYRLKSRQFKTWLRYLYHTETGSGLSAEKFGEAALTLEAVARYEGAEREVHLRVAEHDGAIYLDLCDADWCQVKITTMNWELITSASSPVYFRREEGMLALPVPARGGSLKTLRELLNLTPPNLADFIDDAAYKEAAERADANWTLLLAWLVAALKPSNVTPIAYPLVLIVGEQGSAKTTTTRLIRRTIDPHKADVRAAPKDGRDLAIAANRTRVLTFDNLSRVSEELSNALCRLSTGGAFATRSLYSDDGETIFEARRPVILNGINEVVTRADLQERTLLLSLARITTRRKEAEIFAAFDTAHPQILGALLDAIVCGLKRLADGFNAGDDLPRLADFAVWAEACGPKLGLKEGTIIKAIHENQRAANQTLLDGSPVAAAVMVLLNQTSGQVWQGTVGDLLIALNAAQATSNGRANLALGWPLTAEALTRRLTELAPVLRRSGVTIQRGRRTNQGRVLSLALTPTQTTRNEPSQQSQPSYFNGVNSLQGDGSVTVSDGSPAQASPVTVPQNNYHQPSLQPSPPNTLSQPDFAGSDGSDGSSRPVGAGDGNREKLDAPNSSKCPLPPVPPTTKMPTPDTGYQPNRPTIVPPPMPPGWESAA